MVFDRTSDKRGPVFVNKLLGIFMLNFIANKNGKLSKLSLLNFSDLSYSAIMRLLRNKDVKVNGKRVSSDILLSVGDKVEIYYNLPLTEKYTVVFQDENILVVNKKSGYSFEDVTLDISKNFNKCYPVHRLDRNTAGLMIYALNNVAERELLFGFKNHTFDKVYTANVIGKMPKSEDILNAYLTKIPEKSLVNISNVKTKNSLPIKTGYKVIEQFEDNSIVEVRLYTGKTHQIRAHLSYIGNAIIGDGKYGDNAVNKKFNAKSQRLCATSLTLHFTKNSPLYYLDNKNFSVPKHF